LHIKVQEFACQLHALATATRFPKIGYHSITFVWNEEKARKNPAKHDGVTFQQAAEAFFDPFLTVVDASPNDEA